MAVDCKLRKGAVELYNLEEPLLFASWSYNYAVFGVAQETDTYYHAQCISLFPSS